jgi:hypothetical protein
MRPPPTFGEIAPRLEEAGYEPIPITLPRPDDPQAGKRPAVADWTRGGAVAQWLPRYRHYGVGILTRRTPAVDIDVRHLDAAEAVEALAYRVLGQAPVRIGLAPAARQRWCPVGVRSMAGGVGRREGRSPPIHRLTPPAAWARGPRQAGYDESTVTTFSTARRGRRAGDADH